MKIRMRFTITVVLFSAILVVVGASLILTNRQVERLQKQEDIAHKLELMARELSYLSNDYLLHGESQQRNRWETKFSSFSDLLSGFAGEDPEAAALVRDIKANQERLRAIFTDVISTIQSRLPADSRAADIAMIRVSWSRMEVQNQGIAFDASRLSRMLEEQADRLRHRRVILLFVLIAVFGVFLVINYVTVNRRILRAISDLQAGTRIIGSGNLGFAIEEKKADEIGDLSRAFNRMTANLKAVTASKAELEKAEEQIRKTLESIGDGFFACDANWRFVYVNAPAERVLGIRREEVLGKSHWDVFPLTMGTCLEHEYRRAAAGEARDFENFHEPWGRWFHSRCFPREGGGMSVYFQDITERKRAEEALAASEKNYRELLETANSIIIRWDSRGVIRFINEYGLRFFGYSAEELHGRSVMTILPEVEKSTGRDLAALVRDIVLYPEQYAYVPSENIRKDGKTVWVAWTNKALLDRHGEVREILAIGNDITPLKEAEDCLRASIEEKDVLLKEIHHRVKNNMQVISSLLSLQADELPDAAVRNMFQNVTHRVRSMALVHEKLYQSADLARIDFAEYTESLLHYLWRAYGNAASGIGLALDLEPVLLPVNTAVPCGLILNELVGNALKHAFRGRSGGEVTVSLRSDGRDRAGLHVLDNGRGLPDGFDLGRASSLGLRLVKMLAGQIHAAMEVSSGPEGTHFEIVFGYQNQ